MRKSSNKQGSRSNKQRERWIEKQRREIKDRGRVIEKKREEEKETKKKKQRKRKKSRQTDKHQRNRDWWIMLMLINWNLIKIEKIEDIEEKYKRCRKEKLFYLLFCCS